VKSSTGKPKADGTAQGDLNIPEFGYKTHISIDVEHGFICCQQVTDAAAHDGARLREGLVDPTNTASGVWADTAYRSAANEQFLANRGKVSRIHRKKPAGRSMPKRTARANAKKSKVRARIEHVFAHQKERMGLFIRCIGKRRAEATVSMANISYNLGRWRWWASRIASA
jgi:IS5 family transposase